MQARSLWITGPSRSGKTTRLVEQFAIWVETMEGPLSPPSGSRKVQSKTKNPKSNPPSPLTAPGILVFAANGDNRIELAEQLEAAARQGPSPVYSTTPLGFFQDEVILFWPLLIRRLDLRAQFPVRLRPETEQELATQLWRRELDEGILSQAGVSEYRLVRRTLDLLQLAAVSGTPSEEIPSILQQGFSSEQGSPKLWECMGRLLLRWRSWCLERGLLTYGIIAELYWRYLLPDSTYQGHLRSRYRSLLADDVDEYPAIARDLFDFLLDSGAIAAFTYNPAGGIRLGLNADPNYMALLASRCEEISLVRRSHPCLADSLGESIVDLALNSYSFHPSSLPLPESVRSLQTTSRGQLLRQTAQIIVEAVRTNQVQPQEIALIAPGLDAIARYTLVEILTKAGIPVESLHDQRPLASSPMIRALLTLLALLYPGLGRLIDREGIAEMFVMLSCQLPIPAIESRGVEEPGLSAVGASLAENLLLAQTTSQQNSPSEAPDIWSNFAQQPSVYSTESPPEGVYSLQSPSFRIDPVRAGLLADRCYSPDIARPRLLPVTSFSRWDRLGHQASRSYEEIVQWLEEQRSQLEQRLIPSPVSALDRAIGRFLWNGSNLPYERLSALRELIETAQHYWEVYGRIQATSGKRREEEDNDSSRMLYPQTSQSVGQFIQLLRKGTVTANPYPVRPIGPASQAVTLATIFQYRSSRRSHRWHFWLDAGSPLWLSGGAATLFGAPLFLKDWPGRPWTQEDEERADEQRLRRILQDLLSRVSDRLFLCHSDLAVNGQEQSGPLLSLVNATEPVTSESLFAQPF